MLLQLDPSLADVPDFSSQQLETLTRSVERKKQKLEDDIQQYIARKQEELRNYERELLAQYHSMECAAPRDVDDTDPKHASTATAQSSSNPPPSLPQSEGASVDARKLGPEEKAKRTKHTRVHKREKELCGLVTPIFLPLLEAGDSSPSKRRKDKKKQREDPIEGAADLATHVEQGSPSRDADQGKENRRSRSRNREEKMEQTEGGVAVTGETIKEKEVQKADTGKKSKRAAVKKSSLRHNNTPRSRRKRVSLVIDDQIVLPADNIAEPPPTSPSETTASTASNSTTSLDDTIDPRLITRNDNTIHHDPVHHSLPLSMTLPSTSPNKHTGHTLSDSPPPVQPEAPQTVTETFLDPSPAHPNTNIPPNASNSPIYASEPNVAEAEEEEFSTYVGGISGSGVDDVDQAGSYGYPSSLGASYLESYMQSRPLSVRIAAAEKAELEESEKKKLIQGEKLAPEDSLHVDIGKVHAVDDEDLDIMGEMEGF